MLNDVVLFISFMKTQRFKPVSRDRPDAQGSIGVRASIESIWRAKRAKMSESVSVKEAQPQQKAIAKILVEQPSLSLFYNTLCTMRYDSVVSMEVKVVSSAVPSRGDLDKSVPFLYVNSVSDDKTIVRCLKQSVKVVSGDRDDEDDDDAKLALIVSAKMAFDIHIVRRWEDHVPEERAQITFFSDHVDWYNIGDRIDWQHTLKRNLKAPPPYDFRSLGKMQPLLSVEIPFQPLQTILNKINTKDTIGFHLTHNMPFLHITVSNDKKKEMHVKLSSGGSRNLDMYFSAVVVRNCMVSYPVFDHIHATLYYADEYQFVRLSYRDPSDSAIERTRSDFYVKALFLYFSTAKYTSVTPSVYR